MPLTDQEIQEEIEQRLRTIPHCSACTHWTWEDYGEDGIDIGICNLLNGKTAWSFSCSEFNRNPDITNDPARLYTLK